MKLTELCESISLIVARAKAQTIELVRTVNEDFQKTQTSIWNAEENAPNVWSFNEGKVLGIPFILLIWNSNYDIEIFESLFEVLKDEMEDAGLINGVLPVDINFVRPKEGIVRITFSPYHLLSSP